MANYYSLIADAVAEKHDYESRLIIYERARAGLRELYKVGRLTSAELAQERAALDAAIRKFEADAWNSQRDLVRLESIPAEVTQGQAPGPNSGASDATEANNAEALADAQPQNASQLEPMTPRTAQFASPEEAPQAGAIERFDIGPIKPSDDASVFNAEALADAEPQHASQSEPVTPRTAQFASPEKAPQVGAIEQFDVGPINALNDASASGEHPTATDAVNFDTVTTSTTGELTLASCGEPSSEPVLDSGEKWEQAVEQAVAGVLRARDQAAPLSTEACAGVGEQASVRAPIDQSAPPASGFSQTAAGALTPRADEQQQPAEPAGSRAPMSALDAMIASAPQVDAIACVPEAPPARTNAASDSGAMNTELPSDANPDALGSLMQSTDQVNASMAAACEDVPGSGAPKQSDAELRSDSAGSGKEPAHSGAGESSGIFSVPAERRPGSELIVNKRMDSFVLLNSMQGTAKEAGADQNEGVADRALSPRLKAMLLAARHHGIELDLAAFRPPSGDAAPPANALATWAEDAGLWARALRMHWRHLLRFQDGSTPVVLLFKDGSAGLLSGADPAQNLVLLRDPNAPPGTSPVPVDELRLSEVWGGEAVLVRAARGQSSADAQFNFKWLTQVVLHEHRTLREIALASFTISFLTVFPPLLVMATVNKVLQFHSVSTLILISAILAVVVFYETLLGYARRLVIAVVGARLDARLNLHVFNRLLRLPLDYFERHPAGETMYHIAQIYRVREFLTGRLLTTILDLVTLCVLLPLLFWLNAVLAGIVLGCAIVISLIVLAFLKPLRRLYSQVTAAETWKSAALGETIVGIKTVKALALEPQRRALWDERVAETGKTHLAFARLANWPQTLVTPIERFMVLGSLMFGAYMAMNDPGGYMVGALFAFMMLSARVAQPLVGLARLVEDYEEVNAAIAEAASVLNRPLEVGANASGLRPTLSGAITFTDVTFTYPGTKLPALERMSFDIPAGTMLGVVGRSGSGKSTVTRLLQGINREYQGFIKLDGSDLRDIDLRHLRQSFGVVLQSNFLFRGSIRDNIIAGRPGLTLSDAVAAARLSGAEEFIEHMPNGYETYVEEGSPNLSGGQTQRLAIARALIHNPRILLLDEATSSLDPESEAVVSANLLRIARGRTMVIVSHRLSSLTECDKILVLDQGKVVDLAPHAELLERCAIYRQLWAQQNRHLEGRGPGRPPIAAPRLVPGG